jgi:peptide/nickel transport system substrate-binding protein
LAPDPHSFADRNGDLEDALPAPFSFAPRFGRRRLLAGAAALGSLAVAGRLLGRPSVSASILRAQTDASPVPASSPVAGTPVPTPTPPQSIGQLQIIRDPRPVYDGQPVEGDELRLLLATGDNGDFSPAAFRQDFQILAGYLDPLVWIDEVTMEPVPWLAESWDVDSKGTTITYTLRDDVTWHDGSRIHARDVVFSFTVYRDDLDSAVRNLFTNLESAEAPNRTTVKVKLSSPDANWFLNASSQFVIQRDQYLDYWRSRAEGERTLTGFNWKKNSPIGTGPWKVDAWTENGITFQRNDNYWAGPAHFKTLSINVEADAVQRLDSWKQGQADLLWPVNFSMVQSASDTPGKLYVSDGASVMFAAFNFDNPARTPSDLLSDLRIRQALSLAIDRNRYASEVFGGFIRVDKAGTVAQPWAHDDSIVNPSRDVAKSRELLKEAGWEAPTAGGPVVNAAGEALELSVILRNDSRADLLSLLQSIVPDLAEAGVTLRVRALSPDRFFEVWTSNREYDLIAYAYGLFPGFTDFDLYGSNWDIRQNPQGWNPGGYSNKDVDAAIRAFLNAKDQDGARAALLSLQRAANDDLFGLWFGFPQELILVQSELQGFQPNLLWETWETRLLWRQANT